uniref:Anaphase-promoting complex subunit 4-like WD40 domain-containing protein n=1 Tax=Denticeps clupeoides TaxID=299321 RepID=A0AAY4C2E0_9TELE
MALFGFEKDVHNILKLDIPVTNAPVARWQRKTSKTSKTRGPFKKAGLTNSKSKPQLEVGQLSVVKLRVFMLIKNLHILRRKKQYCSSSKRERACVAENCRSSQCVKKLLHLLLPNRWSQTLTSFAHFIDLDLMDWGKQNLLAVALDHTMEQEEDYISSVSWSKDGKFLEIGTSDCTVQLWDVEHQNTSHTARVGSLSWNDHVLSSGARSGHINHHDVCVAEHHKSTLRGHMQEVCGLKWSPDGKYLASGGNNNMVYVWSGIQDGTSDHHIRIWNVNSGSCSVSLDTQSQTSSLMFVPNYKELVSSLGFTDNLTIWKYPLLTQVADLFGHEGRVLNMALSPDGATIASVAADETIRLWNCFKKDPVKKPQLTLQFSFLNQLIRKFQIHV